MYKQEKSTLTSHEKFTSNIFQKPEKWGTKNCRGVWWKGVPKTGNKNSKNKLPQGNIARKQKQVKHVTEKKQDRKHEKQKQVTIWKQGRKHAQAKTVVKRKQDKQQKQLWNVTKRKQA